MNPIPAISPDEQNVVEFSESPGRRLRVQRQSRGIEVERIAAQLHLRVAAVEALEQDRYQDLPGPVFIAGYLRNYARLLGLDAEPLIAAFRAANPDPEPVGLRVSSLPRQEIGSGHILVRLISLGLLAAVIAMLVLWWQNRAELLSSLTPANPGALALATPTDHSPHGKAAAPAVPRADSATPDPAATGTHPEPTTDKTTVLALPATPPADASQALTVPAPAPDPTEVSAPPAPVPGAPTNPGEVTLTFPGPSWINVRDTAGAVLLKGQMHKGDTRVLAGSPPYSIVIGNPAALRITVGGRPIDVAGRARGPNAHFKFDPRNPE